jgi:hypothetical protein
LKNRVKAEEERVQANSCHLDCTKSARSFGRTLTLGIEDRCSGLVVDAAGDAVAMSDAPLLRLALPVSNLPAVKLLMTSMGAAGNLQTQVTQDVGVVVTTLTWEVKDRDPPGPTALFLL